MTEIRCSECDAAYEVDNPNYLIDRGLFFRPGDWGYYGGFTDTIPWDDLVVEVNMCHDCSLRLVRSFPSIAKALGASGHHPCMSEEPCCEFAWRYSKDSGLQVGAASDDGSIRWENRGD